MELGTRHTKATSFKRSSTEVVDVNWQSASCSFAVGSTIQDYGEDTMSKAGHVL